MYHVCKVKKTTIVHDDHLALISEGDVIVTRKLVFVV